jgi:hypothetical protein
MARPAESYRAVRRNSMRVLKMTWGGFQKEYPLKRKQGDGIKRAMRKRGTPK